MTTDKQDPFTELMALADSYALATEATQAAAARRALVACASKLDRYAAWLEAQLDAVGAGGVSRLMAAPAQPVGFDHKTAANILNGTTVTDDEMRQFVARSRWAHDDRDGLRNTIADLRREIAQRCAEIALLKTSLLDAEAPKPAAQQPKVCDSAQVGSQKTWHRPTALAIVERLERACGARALPPMLIRREFLGEVFESPWPEAVGQ